jgi:hypothetical protein
MEVAPPKVDPDMIHVLLLNNRNEIGEALCRVGSRFGACPKLEKFEIVPTPLGCGYFGCVFPTEDPDVVMKITTDTSEAAFAATRIGAVSPSGGIARYYEGYRIPGLHYLREEKLTGDPNYDFAGMQERVFVLWRESADPAGLRIPSQTARARDILRRKPEAKNLSDDDVFEAFSEFTEIMYAYFRSAKNLARSYYVAEAHGTKSAWTKEIRTLADLASEKGPDFVCSRSDNYAFYDVLEAMMRFSASFVGKELGDFLGRQLIEEHFFLADVRLANMGMVPSSRGPALIDPGLAVYFGTKKLPKLPDLPLQ